MVVRWKCVCAYDGGSFCGWQSQANHRAVQDAIEDVLQSVFKRFVRIHGSGRTDAGVHARGQVFHFDADWNWGSETLKKAINTKLPHTIHVDDVACVTEDFHARFSAHQKTYKYYLLLGESGPFDYPYVWAINPRNFVTDRIRFAASVFEGQHDFRGFAGKVSEQEKTVKTLHRVCCVESGNRLELEFSGSGFLYRMVRMMVGSLVMLGYKKIEAEQLAARLQLKDLSLPIVTAPARGLFLEKITF